MPHLRLEFALVPSFRVREAADLLGVSDDTVRRWADAGRLPTTTSGGRRAIDGAALARFAEELARSERAPASWQPVVGESARNRMRGLVTRVVRDTVMAQVEIQAGPFRIVSLMSREAADELGLEPGILAVAAVKATNVVVEVPERARRLRPEREPASTIAKETPMPRAARSPRRSSPSPQLASRAACGSSTTGRPSTSRRRAPAPSSAAAPSSQRRRRHRHGRRCSPRRR